MSGFYGREFDDLGRLVYDPDDPLGPIKEAIDGADEEKIPGLATQAVEAMCRFGMDSATRAMARAYVKKNKLISVAEFDRITRAPRRKLFRAPAPSAAHAHLHTPPAWASDQDILARVVRTLRVCMGLIGENRAAKLTYLAITSRLLGEPVNLVIKGLSSSGKSYTVECVVRLFPEQAVYTMTAMSERALIYLDESLEHRTIILFEAVALREGREKADDNQTAYIVRSLLSEGRIEYPVVLRDEESGQLRTEKLIKEGPTNIVTSTTAVSLHGENETRMLSLPSNDSKAQTRAVMIESSDEKKRQDTDLSDWHDFQRWLAGQETHDVVIPYARCIAAQIPPDAVRLRRDWNTVRALIRSHALIHQKNRQVDGGRIVAETADYAAVRSLVNDLIADAIGATVPQSVRETVDLVRALTQPDPQQPPPDPDGVKVTKIADLLKLERSAAARRLYTAKDKGYIDNIEDKKGKPARYVTGDPLPGDVVVLPEVHTICTGACTHVGDHEPAGQECDCTGVCRCADTADPREAEKEADPGPDTGRQCAGCGKPIPPGKHPSAVYCDRKCKNAAAKRRARKAATEGNRS